MGQTLPPQTIVIFGASGDLTKRKLLPAFFHLFSEGLMPEDFSIVGYARTQLSDAEFRDQARESVRKFASHVVEDAAWEAFEARLTYQAGEYSEPGAMDALSGHLEALEDRRHSEAARFFHAATPPSAYPDIVARLGESGLARGAKLVIEKPFGRDLASARELEARIHETLEESQVFRIDHYLGKETVQNILAFRFSNGLFEPVWNRRYIDHVQITVAEEIGIEGRGAFYEQTGAIRDMMSTHLFQVLTFLAMEPPVSFDPDRLRDETVKVLRAMKAVDPRSVVRGQYEGYRNESGVATDSQVETFAALEVQIDNWRWAGVPFYLRTGKRMAEKMSEATLMFRQVPYNVFRGTEVRSSPPDHLTIRIQPDEGISLALNAKKPGPGLSLERVDMEFDYAREFQSELLDAYELLLLEAMEGDHTLFIRQDGIERAWEVLMPVLESPTVVVPYEPGSWGPSEADWLLAPRRWRLSAGGSSP